MLILDAAEAVTAQGFDALNTAARDLDPGGPSHDVATILRQSDAHYELVLDQLRGGLR
jgi:hypothetical protein